MKHLSLLLAALLAIAPASAQQVKVNPTGTGLWINRQVIVATGTYTPTLGTNSINVRCVGGGGGGGGAALTSAAQAAIGNAGGSGGYAEKRITSAFSGVTVTIGTAGTAGTAGANAGGAGGNTTFGALLTANGGTGGGGGSAFAPPFASGGGAGGSASSGDINVPGQTGGYSVADLSTVVSAGSGGSSPWGFGGPGASVVNSTGGAPGAGFGAGGSGGANAASQAAVAGAVGTAGKCVVDEYQ